MATWGEQLEAHLPPFMQVSMANSAAAEQHQWEMQQNDQAEAAWDQAQRMAYNERMFEYMHGTDRHTWNLAMAQQAAAREKRDPQAEYGSANRAAVLIDGQVMQPIERAAGPVTMRADSVRAQLARARQQPGREFMQRMVADLEQRQGGMMKDASVISRGQTPEGIQCLDCIEDGNVTVDEYLELHHGADPLPERRVPDYAPQRSRRQHRGRVRSGTGWPEIVRTSAMDGSAYYGDIGREIVR